MDRDSPLARLKTARWDHAPARARVRAAAARRRTGVLPGGQRAFRVRLVSAVLPRAHVARHAAHRLQRVRSARSRRLSAGAWRAVGTRWRAFLVQRVLARPK